MEHSAIQEYDHLVNLIYATAMDPSLWPQLIATLEEHSHKTRLPVEEAQINDSLMAHFKRASTLLHYNSDLRNENALLLSIINRLPIGVIIVNSSANIRAINNRAYELLQRTALLQVVQERLIACNQLQTEKLHQLIHRQANGFDQGNFNTGHIISSEDGNSLSLWVSSASDLGTGRQSDEARIAIYLASRQLRFPIAAASLSSMYGLTASEIKLVQQLANGSHNVRDAAEAAEISYETARTYLKIIFQKTHTHSLPELLKLLLRSPAALIGEPQSPRHITSFSSLPGKDMRLLSIRLPDGRKLAYAEYGDPNGDPVFYFHSLSGGRLECGHGEKILVKHHIRLIAPDRPGFGASDPKRDRNALDWAEDIKALTTHLGIDRFGILSLGAGGAYGLACSYVMPERIHHLCMVSVTGLQPDSETIQNCGALPIYRTALRMAIHMPGLLSQTVRMIYKVFMRDIDQYWQRIYPSLCESDRQQIEHHRDLLKSAFLDSGQQGSNEVAREFKLFVSPWGFDVSDIQTPITIWHGRENRHAPMSLCHAMVAKLQHAELIEKEDEGFYMIYKLWPEIIEKLVGELGRQYRQ